MVFVNPEVVPAGQPLFFVRTSCSKKMLERKKYQHIHLHFDFEESIEI